MTNPIMLTTKLKALNKMNIMSIRTYFVSFFFFLMLGIFYTSAQVAVPFTPRLAGDNIKVKGDITLLSNNILNTRIVGPSQNNNASHANNDPWNPNDAYNNGNANNQRLPMAYIDIDSDPTTFSSSSASLNAPTCSRVVYAGLYWGGTYPYNEGNSTANADATIPYNGIQANDYNRDQPYESVKFKIPGSPNYVDIGPGSPAIFEYERIYDVDGDLDGDGNTDPGVSDVDLIHSPYLNYANVTHLLAGLGDNPNGEYTIANVVGTLERKQGGNLAGWTMVVIYENPNLNSKYISTFDGMTAISNGNSATFDYTGFRTLPGTLPVNARLGVSAMEGDRNFIGPQIQFKANSTPISATPDGGFTKLSNTLNPVDNFFNSTITDEDATGNPFYVTTRNPNSENTLGWDTDIFELDNPLNNVLPNDETGAEVKILLLNGSGDITYLFLNTISVDIIEPEIVVEKNVTTPGRGNITGQGVNLGEDLTYVLDFENIGNDDATGPDPTATPETGAWYTIRDRLPLNVTPQNPTRDFNISDVTMPAGVRFSYDVATRDMFFYVPNELVENGHPGGTISIDVRVAETCFDFVDACTDIIQNLAFSTYAGTLNTNTITDDPSVTALSSCGLPTPGATNFLLDDLAACNFTRTAILCGPTLTLDAGDNFDEYDWYRDENGNNQIDVGIDTLLLDGGSGDDTLVVNDIGTYMVNKQVDDPCKDFNEIIIVERFGETQTNPIIDFFNDRNSDANSANDIQGEIIADCNDGTTLFPNLFLCGINDAQFLQIPIADAQSLSWEKLNETNPVCTVQPEGCLNRQLDCNWDQVGTGSDFNINAPGKYRFVIIYEGGCTSRFYFNAFQNTLPFTEDSEDIVCNTDGYVTVNGLSNNYGYRLVDHENGGAVLVDFDQRQGPRFNRTSGENGTYRIEIVQLDGPLNAGGNPIPGACIFSTDPMGVLDRNLTLDIDTTEANCNVQGTIEIDALGVFPDYTYELWLNDGTAAPAPPANDPYYGMHPGGTFVDDETAQPNNTYTFNVNPGNYFVVVRTDEGCVAVQDVTVTRTPDPTLTALTTAHIGCHDGAITLTAANGDPSPYYYAIWRKDGTNLYTSPSSIPASAFQTDPVFTFTIGEEGDYVFLVADGNNCVGYSNGSDPDTNTWNPVTIENRGVLAIDSIDEEQPSCSGDADGELTINITGGVGSFRYSIDNGATYQSTSNFVGLTAGSYEIRVLDSSGCDTSQGYLLNEPFPLSASAGVSRDATCDPANGAEVRITNVVGGSGTYEYSFDGGGTWGPASTAILPPGNYTVLVRDDSCSFPMSVTVEGLPMPPNVALTPEVNYNCNGTGTITASPSIAGYDYRYALDGVLNTPEDNNVFTNVAPGTYTVRTYYRSQTPPTPSLLLTEDFGVGNGTIPSPDTQGYNYEDQTNSTAGGGDSNSNINDFEYSVTNNIVAPFGPWVNPNDHTNPSDPNGRFLVINVGTPSPGQIIYTKPINDVIPNRPLQIRLHIFNLLSGLIGNTQLDPDLTIEIRTSGGTVIESIRTGAIAKNTGPDDWVLFATDFDPGANTNLEFVIRSEISGNSGNDLALDDIEIFQTPEVCELFVETPVTVEAARAFTSAGQSSTNVSCNGLSDGTITFTVENFDATAGFEYSIDGGTTWINSTSSPVTTDPVFGAGLQTVQIRKADEITCTTSITRTITEPSVLVITAGVTTNLSCTTLATITADNATGGTAAYEYQLEDNLGNAIATYDFVANGNNRVFSGLSDGTYVVRVRDANTCEDIINTPLVIAPMNPVAFTVTETTCHTGGNTASIQVDVTNGNGGYQFRIDSGSGPGPWLTPAPTSAITYTFNNLSSGTYDIDVRDQSGCPVALATETVTINSQLSISVSAPNISVCDTDADITVTATGGDGNYVYSVVPSGNTPTDGSFNTTNPITGFTSGNYDVYVRDNNGDTVAGFCEASFPITITQDDPIAFTPTPTDVNCHGGSNGSISVIVDSGGEGPFTYSINSGAYGTPSNFPNLTEGTYQIRVRDANLCESAIQSVTVNEPDELMATATQTQDYTCAQLGQITVTPTAGGSGNYQFSIDGGSWTASAPGAHIFTDLDDGTYSIRVRDANVADCIVTLGDVIIAPLPVAPTVTYSVVYNCDGTGNVTIAPFDASYTYILDGTSQTGATGNIFNNIAIGTFPLRVTYSTDCHVDTNVIIENGNAFEANFISAMDVSCNGLSNAAITFEVANFEGATGFEYSEDGGTTWITSLTSPVTTNAVFGAGSQTIPIRRENEISCTTSVTHIIAEPNALVVSASVTTDITCADGATITASTVGGNPDYEYQLEINDDGDNTEPYNISSIVTPYQTSPVFNNIPANAAGENYVVRVRDRNMCEDVIDTAITITDPNAIVFDVTPTTCYSGANDGEIVVNVTGGNGGYQFRIDLGSGPGPWMTPTPASATTFTFANLSNGSYDIEVRDQLGCPTAPNTQTATINPLLTATIDIVDISCTDGSITVNATGGDGNYAYAYMPTGSVPVIGDFVASNTFAVTTGNDGDYNVYVRDNNAVAPAACNYLETVTVDPAVTLAFTATPTAPECHDGTGSIAVNITSGDNPYTVELIDLDNGGSSDQTLTNVIGPTQNFFNLATGNYTVIVTDANSCNLTRTPVTITNPDELTADILGIAPVNCDPTPNLYGFEFDNYPATLGTLEFSADGGTNWQASDTFVGASYASGTEVEPSIRVLGTTCQTDFPRYTIPYPLDDLDISISAIIVDCNDLQVTVQGTEGLAPYEYTFSEDPVNFDPATATWQPGGTIDSGGNTVPAGEGRYIFTGLVPGRTYVFYVRDSSPCVRQSSQNVNDLAPPPVLISGNVTPDCSGTPDNGQITYTVTETTPGELGGTFDWELFRIDDTLPLPFDPPASVATGTVVGFSTGDSFDTPVPASLGEGDYFVEIRGAAPNNCVIGSENIRIEELDPITFTPVVVSHITCANPGRIEIQNPQGGGGMYTYTLTSPDFIAPIITTDNPIEVPISNLVDPTVTPFNVLIEIADQYSCPVTTLPSHTVSMNISQSPTISTVATTNCSTPNGITITATGGTAPYLYSIDGGTTYVNNGGTFNNVAVGSYNISIIDSHGCTDTDSAEIYPTLQASAANTKLLDCTVATLADPNAPNAEITVSATDGSGSYDYEIDGPGTNDEARTALPSPANSIVWDLAAVAGTYTVSVYDNNRTTCPPRTFTVEVPVRLEPIVDNIDTTNVTCNGDTDGTITISAVDNAIGPYTFEITANNGAATSINPTSTTNTSATFTGLAPTTGIGYTVTIRAAAANNCSTNSIGIPIGEPAAIVVPSDNVEIVQFGCATGNSPENASITVDLAVTTPVVSNVTGGSGTYVRYRFYRTDDPLTGAVEPDSDIQDSANDSYIVNDLLGGYYAVEVYDDEGCFGITNARINPYVEISDPMVVIDTDVTCNGDDAQVSITFTQNPASATPTLAYSVVGTNNPYSQLNQPGNIFTLLGVGNYIATVTNTDTNCSVQTPFEIEDPNNFEITATTTDVLCDGGNGTVSFTINDPVNPYTGGFSWRIYNSQGTVAAGDDVLVVGANGTSVNVGPTIPFDIGEGEYRVEILQDSDPDCTASEFFTIAGPNGPIMATVEVTPISCAPGNDGIIEITNPQGGWGDYKYYVSDTAIPDEFDDTNYVTNPRFNGLAADTYEIWIIDQNGCPRQLPDETLNVPTAIVADLQINQGNCTDFSGEIEVVGVPSANPVSGGQGNNYTYQLFRNTVAVGAPQNTRTFSGLGEGSYTVEVRDQLGCTLLVGPEVLYDVIAPDADIVKTIDCNSGGEITITQAGGSGTFRYDVKYPLSAPATVDDTNTNGVFTGLNQIGDYVFTITDTGTGAVVGPDCSTTVTQRLEARVEPIIQVDAFANVTCNGDDDGTISVSVNPDNGIGPYTFRIVSGPGSGAAFPIAASSSTNATAVFNGLEGSAAGITYTIEVTAANGCTDDIIQVITEPDVISNFTVDEVQFGCTAGTNTANTASLTVDVSTLSGGSNNFTRFLFVNTTTASTVQDGSNPIFVETDYDGGNYEITAFDENGCASPVETATINPFVRISDPTVTDVVGVTCNPGNDAQIQVDVTVSPLAATPNLEYTINGINATHTDTNNTGLFTGLSAGNYSISITNLDAHPDCIIETVHTIEEPEEMQVVATKLTDEECLNNGVDDGSFEVEVTNYTGNFSYQVFDNNDNPVVGFNGTGTAPTTFIVSNLPGGLYYVQVDQQPNFPACVEDSNIITILAPENPIAFTPTEASSVSCSNDQGSIRIVPTGGEGPYTISYVNTTTSQTDSRANVSAFIFTGLPEGDYDFTVEDVFGCSETGSITLTRPDDIDASITASTLVCFGDDTASITATFVPRNVTPVYEYQLNVYSDLTSTTPNQVSVRQSPSTFTNLGAGFYSITITDDIGCSDESNRIQIIDPTEVQAQLLRTSPLTCSTGVELELRASGGTGPYEYFNTITNSWIAMSGGDTEAFPNTDYPGPLPDGAYRFMVRDAGGCESLPSNEITEDVIIPLTLEVDTTAAFVNCTGENTARIYAEASGGLGNYQYELYDDYTGSLSDLNNLDHTLLNVADRIVGPIGTGEFTGLSAGTYYVNVISEDCNTNPQQVVIAEPTPLVVVNPMDFTNVTCNGEDDGTIMVELQGGAGGYIYAISPNLDQFDTENTFTDLEPGDYTVIAQDQNGCFELLLYTITEPTVILVDPTPLPEVCVGSADGSITLEITGGTAPYRTALNSNSDSDFVQDRLVFNGLTGGNYLIFVRDANDCETNVVVDIDPGVNLNATIEPVYECSGDTPDNYVNITLEDPTVIGDVLYALDAADPLNPDPNDLQLNPDFRNSSPGEHFISIAHSNGCVQAFSFEIEAFEPLTLILEQNNINEITALAEGGNPGYTFFFGDRDNGDDNTIFITRTDTYVVTVIDENGCETQANIFMEFIDIEIPNFFTPDGDGQNDVWIPRNMEGFPQILTIIFDRYGREVYRFGLNDEGWDGFYQQTELPTGDYWYVLKLNGEEDNREFVGHFTLYR